MLSGFSELYNFNISSTSKILSLSSAAVWSWILICFILLSLINWIRFKDLESFEIYIPLKELFSGLRCSRASTLYTTVMLSRRAFFVGLLIFGSSFTNTGLVCPMIVIQFAYFLYLVIVRPFKLVKDNLIEITNEWFYLILLGLLSYFNSEDKWNTAVENIYLLLILLNSAVIILIMISKSLLF